jgi:hypothetical protein
MHAHHAQHNIDLNTLWALTADQRPAVARLIQWQQPVMDMDTKRSSSGMQGVPALPTLSS